MTPCTLNKSQIRFLIHASQPRYLSNACHDLGIIFSAASPSYQTQYGCTFTSYSHFFLWPGSSRVYIFSEIALHLLRRSAYDYPPTETSNWKTQIFVAFIPFFSSLFSLMLRSLFCLSHLTAEHPTALFIHPPIKILAVQRNVCAYACVKGYTLLASSQHALGYVWNQGRCRAMFVRVPSFIFHQ